MRKIILASKSRARRKLLRQVGLKFRVVGSDAKEAQVLKGR
ncbi:MAG: Maf family protein, partial [Candidatus Omnitrophota bacterium]